MLAIDAEWNRRQEDRDIVDRKLEERIQGLRNDAELTVAKMKFLNSETAIKYMEEDLLKIEKTVEKLVADRSQQLTKEKPDMKSILQRVKKLMEHPVELYENQIDPIKKAQFFRLFFKDLPSYNDWENRTLKTGTRHPLLALIKNPSNADESLMVMPPRIELVLPD